MDSVLAIGSDEPSEYNVCLGEYLDISIAPEKLILIMDIWVKGIDKMIQLLKESKTDFLQKKIDRLYSQRGITYDEFYYLTLSNLEEEMYMETPAYLFTKTFSKELRDRRYGNLEYNLVDYKHFITSFDLEPIKYVGEDSRFNIDIDKLFSHSYCVAKTRSGKTELFKLIVYNVIKAKELDTSLLILDPHGEMAREVRRLKIVNQKIDDVVYIDPTIDSNHTPVFNPFYVRQKDSGSLAYMTDSILDAFQQLLKDHSITGNMRRLLRHLIHALLYNDGTTMMDLLTLLTGISRNRNQKLPEFYPDEQRLMELGLKVPDPLARRFFEYGWKEVDSRTITAVIERIDGILSHPLVRNFVIGENSIDLNSYLNEGKIVIVNLDFTKLGNIGSEAIGRLIVSEAQNVSAQRNKLPKAKRPKTLIFIDECQRFVSAAIERALSEFSKFNTYIFLAHQYIEQVDDGMLKGMLSNTENKIIGRNSAATMGAVSDDIQVSKTELLNIKKYQFYMKIGDQPPILFKSSDKLLDVPDNEAYISEEEAKETFDQLMIKRYYRPIKSFSSENENKDTNRSGLEVNLSPEDF